MADCLILCPTFNHADALYMSIASVRAQTLVDWKMHVICDGVPDKTLAILEAIAAQDPRISYSSHPKSVRYGEEHRGGAILASDAKYVFHLNDDDIWLPNHLERMVALLQHGDWVNQAPMRIATDGSINWWPINHGTSAVRTAVSWVHGPSAGINYVAYRREAYENLLHPWSPAPWELGTSDRFQWSKFMSDPKVQVASIAETTVLKFPSHMAERKTIAAEMRAAELGPWLARVHEKGVMQEQLHKARVYDRFSHLILTHGAWDANSTDDMLERCGMRRVAADVSPEPAVAGAIMPVPLTNAQYEQAGQALAHAKKLRRKLAIWPVAHLVRRRKRSTYWIEILFGLSRHDRPRVREMLRAEAAALNHHAGYYTLSACLAHEDGDVAAVQSFLTEAAVAWPEATWPAMMQERLKAGIPAPAQ